MLIAPLMPGINDAPEQVEPLLEAAAEAGATGIGGIALHLRGEVKALFFDWLRAYRPDLVELYEQLYARGAYAPQEERKRLSALLRSAGIPPPSRFGAARADPAEPAPAPSRSDPPHEQQGSLF